MKELANMRAWAAVLLAVGVAACGGLIDTGDVSEPTRDQNPGRNGWNPSAPPAPSGESSGEPTSDVPPMSPPPSASQPPSVTDAGERTPPPEGGSEGGSEDASPPDAGVDPSLLYTGGPEFLAVDGTNLYWTDYSTNSVMTMEKHGGPATSLSTSAAPFLDGPRGIAVDGASVYWTESTSVRSVPLGGGPTTVLASNQNYSLGIAVDATSLYWTNVAGGTVMRSNLDGSNAHAIATAQNRPVSVKVQGDVVIWTNSNWPQASIVRAGLDGEGAQVLYSASQLFDFATDGTDLFFVESIGGDGKFRRMPLAGGATVLLSSAGNAGGGYRAPIAIDGNSIWLSWFGGNGLVKYPRAGGPAVKLQPQPYGSTPGALDIVLDDAFVYWIESVSEGKRIKRASK